MGHKEPWARERGLQGIDILPILPFLLSAIIGTVTHGPIT